jgi:hypothetical protein
MPIWGKRMLGGVTLMLAGAGIIAIGGTAARVFGTVLVVVGIFVMPFLTGFGDRS